MAFANLGFETAQGVFPGQAQSWTVSFVSTAVELALYDFDPGDPTKVGAYEGFEGYWTSNHLFITGFTNPVAQLDQAIYSTLEPSTKFVEDFEELWTSNENFVTEDTLEEQAVYLNNPVGGTDEEFLYDGFEGGWLGPDAPIFNIEALNEVAEYGIGIPYEDFETEWVSSYLTAFSDGINTTAATYDQPVPDEPYEDFEELWGLTMTTV